VPYHLWHFSPRTLEEVLARAGLRLMEVKSFTPGLWLAQSFCLRLGERTGGRNRALRSVPLLDSAILAARLLLPFFSRADRRLRGDCLVANARVEH